jgi:Tfp pilus assembly protein PilO
VKRARRRTWKLWRIDAVGGAACAVATLVFYFGGVAPLLQGQAELAGKQTQLQAQRRRASEQKAAIPALEYRLAELRRALEDSRVHLQPLERVNTRMAEIADAAGKSGLKLDDIQLGRTRSGPRYTTVDVLLAGSGTYRDCVGFLRRLNQTFLDTSVSVLELSGRPEEAPVVGSYRMQLVWYAAPTSGSEK